jgi:hypothetical protein
MSGKERQFSTQQNNPPVIDVGKFNRGEFLARLRKRKGLIEKIKERAKRLQRPKFHTEVYGK